MTERQTLEAQAVLPLFAAPTASEAGFPVAGSSRVAGNKETRKGDARGFIDPALINPHLRAARRLSRKIGRLPDRSAEQIIIGQAICQHLKALLGESAGTGR